MDYLKRIFALTALFCLVAGCSGKPKRVDVPTMNETSAASDAIKAYDKDGDGMIGGDELKACGSIQSALRHIDKDSDGKVTSAELMQRFDDWKTARVAVMNFGCMITKGGSPVTDATVTFEPEPFLPHLSAGRGTTDVAGICDIGSDDPAALGMLVGFYRVKISKLAGGKETLPAEFNESTTLGAEVSRQSSGVSSGLFKFDLK